MAHTTIPVAPRVRDRLRKYGHAGETYNDILTRLMDESAERMLASWMRARVAKVRDTDWVDLEDIR